jgi:uncharacterized protein YycO
MSNRFADIENTIQRTRARGKRRANARKRTANAEATKPAADESVAMRALGKRRRMPLGMMLTPNAKAFRVRAFATPVDYAVPGPFDVMAQPNAKGCWATVFTMMYGWKVQQSMPIEAALANVGQKWVDHFKAGEWLLPADKNTFLAEAGLVAEPPMSFSIEGWEHLLRDYGPVWVTTDEDPGPRFSIHARIITAIRGDGTPDGTRLHLIDPAGGREYDETIAAFIPKFESEVLTTGNIRVQVVHWKAGARVSGAQSFGRAMSGRFGAQPRPTAHQRSRGLTQGETLEQTKARLVTEGVPQHDIDAFLATLGIGKQMSLARARALSAAPVKVSLPTATIYDDWRSNLLLAAITAAAPGLGSLMIAARTIANRFNVTVGMGPSVQAGLGGGIGVGVGILFAPGNRVGVYGSVNGIVGLIVSISATFQLTVVHGGPEAFGGDSYAVGVSVDTAAGPQVGGHALFTLNGKFQGITGEVGVSAGLSPFEAFAQYQHTDVAMANSLALRPGTFARVVAFSDIPLDPGAGGRSIGVDALEPGDIILSTTNDLGSRVIRAGTGSEVSHASIYVGNGQIVEALADGVGVKSVGTAISDDSVAVAFRYPNLTVDQQKKICDAAKAAVGRKYDYWGIVDQARFKLAPTFCEAVPAGGRAACESWLGKVDFGSATNDAFYCSELVIVAFQAAGIQLTSGPGSQKPEDLARLRLNNALQYVGHLKTS